ncbi:S9 family peptidase [Pseudonocardiaceae bacterium YIM PH 21723]|nr:S9 family peptidase [Pseudonocardiaceae bacterium YIM PH 21723]
MADDPYLWLEEVTGDDALRWVTERNAASLSDLTSTPRFTALRDEIREALDADTRIPYVRRRGEYLYNFWRDAQRPRGVWRRTTLDSYRTDSPEWDEILDIDALAEAEGENWVWQGATTLYPGYELALVELSRGGADAAVVREFDLRTRQFVADGFTLPEAKSRVDWIDADTVYVGTDFGDGALTTSGYPRIAKRWRRGTPLSEAETVFEGAVEDVSITAYYDPTPGFERHFVHRAIEFYRSERYLLDAAGELRLIEIPEDAKASIDWQWLLVQPRTAWGEYPAGSLIVIELDAFLAGSREFTVLFTPDAHTSLTGYSWTRSHLVITVLTDVRTSLHVLTPGEGWARTSLPAGEPLDVPGIVGTDPLHSEEYLLDSDGFTRPSTLSRGEIGGDLEPLKQAPEMFDASGLEVEQYFATSADGTRVPYFVVRPRGARNNPTLLTGYGGFQHSQRPYYSSIIGRGWLARGGSYVLANIRGGGEYGPEWHTQALKENRLRAYEDFAAVAKDLVERGITTPERLGVRGGSNGGLLTGVMLTRYPELFGAVVSEVPLLDMRRYHLLLAGASWMAEYGDPDQPDQWAYLREYSPYHNIDPLRSYPPVFITTSTRDDRVHPGHARKMVARLLENGHDVRYFENIEGGHGGASNNEQHAHHWALTFEFLWRHLAD